MPSVGRRNSERISDPLLSEIADRHESHRFLMGATGMVYRRQVAQIDELIHRSPSPNDSIRALDWGCGKGHITYFLKKSGYDVTSCDVVSGQPDSSFHQDVPILTELAVQPVPLDDPVRLPFGADSFDVVTSFGVLEHVADDEASLREIARVLVPGGLFFCSFLPYRWSWTQRVARLLGDGYHDRLYSNRRVRHMFAAARLDVRSISHGQLFPKNGFPASRAVEWLDNFLCRYTPLRFLATNLIVVATLVESDDPDSVGQL